MRNAHISATLPLLRGLVQLLENDSSPIDDRLGEVRELVEKCHNLLPDRFPSTNLSLSKLIRQLENLRDSANLHSMELIRDGQEIPEEHRARAGGYADAYAFCIMQLRRLEE